MPAVPPKTIRAATRTPVTLTIPANLRLACWNWALNALEDGAPPLGMLYEYVNGGAIPTVGDFPNLNPGHLADLLAVRNTYAPYRNLRFNADKQAILTQCSKRMLPIICGVYGLTVSAIETDVEVGMKFESQLMLSHRKPNGLSPGGVKLYRVELQWELDERLERLDIGYEHMWIRFKKKTTIETWVNRGTLTIAHNEQPPDAHKTVHRVFVSSVLQEHLNKINAILRTRKNAPMYAHPPVRQPWIPDAGVRHCTWCGTGFGYATRKHHCRACGKIFCSDCAFKTEMVQQPSNDGNAVVAASVQRVCDTCYTGAT